ncbi:MAG: LysR family transcriptional regulator [Labilithrix sp.]|nr:LysR family transcriptional regulator [Labilithrix sp.]MCW5815496.1 LysR family transcriptional regulator [Labilithrix sp.]
MDLNRITAFVRVVEEGSFTKAAAVLDLPKSSVSRSVALLEEDLGAKLLQRSSRKVTLTEIGTAYYARVGRALVAIEEANTATADERVVPRGTIRVAVPPSDAGTDLFMPLIARFVAQHPHIHVEVSVSARHVDIAGEGFDFAIRAGFVRDPSLIARKITTTSFALYASPSYLAARGTPRSLGDLRAHDCILFHGERRRVKWTLTNGERTESVDVTGRLNVDALAEVRSAARAGAGIGVLVPPIVSDELETGELVRVLPEWYGPPMPLSIVYPSARFVPHRVALLRDHLLTELTKLDWSCHGHPRPPPRPRPRKKR